MRWEDERYVRIYTRDTVEWEMLSWQARALWPLLLRKMDRAGLLELGRHGVRGLAATVKMPADVVEPGLAGLLEDGCVQQRDTTLIVPNFIDAQETPSSDALRAKEYRARRRQEARDGAVTKRDESITTRDETVTQRHTASHGVTPYCAVPNHAEEESASASPPSGSSKPKRTKPAVTPTPDALRVLEALNAGRKRVIHGAKALKPTTENLCEIEARLRSGNDVDDLLHVIAVAEREVKAGGKSDYFDALTPFRAGNIARYLCKPAVTNGATNGARSPAQLLAEQGRQQRLAEYEGPR